MTQGAGSSAPIKSTNNMTREERIKNARAILDGDCSDELREALVNAFPELAESDDERIRKKLYNTVLGTPSNSDWFGDFTKEQMLAYLEKQKEQQPAGGSSEKPNHQWSEEDGKDIQEASDYLRDYANNCVQGGNSKLYLQSLADRIESLRPQPHWKPSEEQMEALNEIINILAVSMNPHENDYLFNIINGLRKNLKKL